MIHPAAKFQFERVVAEYARWLAVAPGYRSPAPGWWWGPAFALREATETLPQDWSRSLHLPDGARYADAARLFLDVMAGQIFQPWPSGFPGQSPEPLAEAAAS